MTFTQFSIVVTTVLLICNVGGLLGLGWNYDGSDGELGPGDWQYNYSACAGNQQSPIDIVTSSASGISVTLTFTGYNSISNSNFTVTNNGHTIQVTVNDPTITLTKSGLNGTYVLEQFHFHWGNANNNGSEHSVNGVFYPLEIHFVHYNRDKYGNVSHAAAANDSSALLVIGVFATVSSNSSQVPSSAVDTLEQVYNQVSYGANKTVIQPFALQSLLPCTSSTVYTYSGSLTTPPCAQVVNWNVFSQPIYVNLEQLTKFRELHGNSLSEELNHNFRPVQLLNGRTINSYTVPSAMACPISTASTAAPTTTVHGVNIAGSVHSRVPNAVSLVTIVTVVLHASRLSFYGHVAS